MDGQLYIQHFENESDKILIYFNRFDYNIDLLILNIQLFFSDGLSFINSWFIKRCEIAVNFW